MVKYISFRKQATSALRHKITVDMLGEGFYVTVHMKLLNELPEKFPAGHTLNLAVSSNPPGESAFIYLIKLLLQGENISIQFEFSQSLKVLIS